jgi:phage baseplate assembly protein W
MSDFRDFLGRGLNFPVAHDRKGGMAMSAFEENVEQAIQIIIGTAPGERMMRPDYGCKIHELLFQPANHVTCSLAAQFVKKSLVLNEPRVRGIEVDCRVDDNEPNKLNLHVRYTVRASNNIFNQVYPFYLRREEDL